MFLKSINRHLAQKYSLLKLSAILIGLGTIPQVSSGQTGTVTTIAGSGSALLASEGNGDGIGRAAKFANPQGVATDSAGNIFVVDTGVSRIRKITPAGVVTTFAGGSPNAFADGLGSNAGFAYPEGIAIDKDDNIYVADTQNSAVRKITHAGMVSTLAGGVLFSTPADGIGSAAGFYRPCGIATDSDGNIYVSDRGFFNVRKITPAGMVSTLAGATWNAGYADGFGSNAKFRGPQGIAVDNSGNVYVADNISNIIRKITPAGMVTTLAGIANGLFDMTPVGTKIDFYSPSGVTVDSDKNIYVVDSYSIQKITPAGVITTIAGATRTGNLVGTDFDGIGDAAQFVAPMGITINSDGNLMYVADGGYHSIRKVVISYYNTSIITQPASITDSLGRSISLSVTAAGTEPLSYQWKKDGAIINGETSATLALSSINTATAGNFTVVVSGPGGTVESSTATVTVVNPSRLTALSVRTVSGSGDNVLFVGLAISGGESGEAKQVIARGVGPVLGKSGLTTFMPDPALWVYSGSNVIASNDDWNISLKPILNTVGLDNLTTGSKDSAILAQLGDGGYPIKVGSKENDSGVVMAEVYETDKTTKSHMYALSVRANAGTGEQTLIAGFVIEGTVNERLVIRGLGPAMASALGSGYLLDPQIQVYSGQTVIASNDNWTSTPDMLTAFASVGLTPMTTGSKDAALTVSLPPGGYTVFLTGVNNTTGIGLIEIYELP